MRNPKFEIATSEIAWPWAAPKRRFTTKNTKRAKNTKKIGSPSLLDTVAALQALLSDRPSQGAALLTPVGRLTKCNPRLLGVALVGNGTGLSIGVHGAGSSPTVTNSVISYNRDNGVYLAGSSCQLENCTISRNGAGVSKGNTTQVLS
jgi:parallel beta-helix repeat protein